MIPTGAQFRFQRLCESAGIVRTGPNPSFGQVGVKGTDGGVAIAVEGLTRTTPLYSSAFIRASRSETRSMSFLRSRSEIVTVLSGTAFRGARSAARD